MLGAQAAISGGTSPPVPIAEKTLIVFQLDEVEGGTQLTITESGFDQIPLERRAEAFKMNTGGWEAQAKLIEKYVTR